MPTDKSKLSTSPTLQKVDSPPTMEKGNWQRDFYRALAAGFAVPMATLPLEKIETQVTIKRGFKVAWQSTLENPWSGYRFKASTNTLRTFLLFNNTGYARDYFNAPGSNPLMIDLKAGAAAALIEGTVMSFKTPIMQKIQTDKTANFTSVIAKNNLPEFYKAWRVAWILGVTRDLTYWPLWITAVQYMKVKLLVERQPETPVKMWEQFMIGATAAIFVSPVSFPAHGLMRRLLDEKVVPSNLIEGIKMDFNKSWAAHKASNQPTWKYVPNHIYRGFIPAALVILPLNMGLTNLFKHLADVVYAKYKSRTLFARPPIAPVVANQEANDLSSEYLKRSL